MYLDTLPGVTGSNSRRLWDFPSSSPRACVFSELLLELEDEELSSSESSSSSRSASTFFRICSDSRSQSDMRRNVFSNIAVIAYPVEINASKG